MRTRVALEEACALMTGSVRALGVEQVSRQSALGRTLAEDVAAPLDQPPFDRSPSGRLCPALCRSHRGLP